MKHSRCGFTLIEIMAAIFIFALLLSTLYGSFRLLLNSDDALGNSSVQLEMAQSCLARMASDIEAIYVTLPPAYKQPEINGPPDPYRITGEASFLEGHSFSRFRFTSLEHFSFIGPKIEGVAEIVYYVAALKDGGYVLRRADQLFPYKEFEEKDTDPILCKNIIDFSVKYYDEDGKETESWDSESSDSDFATPRSVGITLRIGNEEKPMVFSTRIQIPVYREKIVSPS